MAPDAVKYFSDLERHRLAFDAAKDEDRQLIDMAFNKKKADDRKEWLRQFKVKSVIAQELTTAWHILEPRHQADPHL